MTDIPLVNFSGINDLQKRISEAEADSINTKSLAVIVR